ncbi:MAG: hypothetical protein ABR529_06510 [Actinomycetota bacterium]
MSGIAREWQLSEDSVRRHKLRHLLPPVNHAKAARRAVPPDVVNHALKEAERPFDYVRITRSLLSQAVAVLQMAKSKEHILGATSAIREATRCVELLARLEGELQTNTQVNVLVAPEWVSLRSVLLAALAPYPEARAAVGEALRELNAGPVQEAVEVDA